jgi:hypothetical protein
MARRGAGKASVKAHDDDDDDSIDSDCAVRIRLKTRKWARRRSRRTMAR